MDAAALALSLKLAGLTTVVLLAVGLPLAWWLTVSRFRGKVLVEAVVALPLVLPPTVLGFYLLTGLGPRSPAGRVFEAVAGHPFPFSFAGLLVASVLYSLPFAVQPFAAALAGVDRRLVEASHTLGVSRLGTFLRVTLPLAWPGVIAGAVLSFAHTLGEFGVVLMVGGNIPGRTRTLAVAIFDHVEALEYAAAHRTAGLLLAISFGVLTLVYALQRRPAFRWNER
ncbi:molybdate ABC transporter permease subunit [Anaeromyxobacter dehalogenans]|uniref:Molybdenum transport system permease n=1 Tax=Anaeromyxobacter dehalogenans (strain 2CP-C) TaxID=290397 RepID=Q2IPN9_ANADE|nr:molybdate ABC transporter permease subunit [Anaeromyxobacter dehalogenans]ABC80774.1 molybdate ABC transporter, inner membrane subunit [Anaeromyxobacter dehalogenans 2CP-C]